MRVTRLYLFVELKSNSINTQLATGKAIILYFAYEYKSNFIKAISARVIPQVGQGMLVVLYITQFTSKTFNKNIAITIADKVLMLFLIMHLLKQ